MIAALEAHIEAMAAARASGDLRTVIGHAYPIPEAAMRVYLAHQAEVRQAKTRAFLLSRTAARAMADRAFT